MDKGEFAVRFVESLRHVKGRWASRQELFRLLPWQRDYTRRFWGTLKEDGRRQYRIGSLWLPRKAGKSNLAAAYALLALVGDGERGGEVYSAAADRQQASIVFDVAASMVRADPYLSSVCKIRDSRKTIIHTPTDSTYRAISADAHNKHGFNASCVIADEIHAWPSEELWEVLSTSQGAREQPVLISISTAGYDRYSFAYRLYEHAKRVEAEPDLDPAFLPLIFEAGEEDDWTSPETWHKANPSLGETVGEDFYKAECQRAKEMPTYQEAFRRLYLNVWTSASERWLPADKWDKCKQALDLESLKGKPCFAGLDLSSSIDLSCLTLLFRDGDKWLCRCWTWIPEETARKRQEKDRVPYLTWVKAGHVEATPGDVIDYAYIRRRINELADQYDIREIALDRWNATQLSTELEGDGHVVVPFGQGFGSMAAPSKELEKLVMSGQLAFDSPVMHWAGGNVVAERDAADNVKPSKKRSSERIDPVVALIMALGRAIVSPTNPATSVYSERGLLTL